MFLFGSCTVVVSAPENSGGSGDTVQYPVLIPEFEAGTVWKISNSYAPANSCVYLEFNNSTSGDVYVYDSSSSSWESEEFGYVSETGILVLNGESALRCFLVSNQ